MPSGLDVRHGMVNDREPCTTPEARLGGRQRAWASNSPRSAGGLSPLFVSARPMHTLLAGPVQWRAKFL
jgi:hypothetical protein